MKCCGGPSGARFDFIRYANCWEDADVLCAALAPAPGRRMLSIASGGDNTFALLAEGADVVAADISPAQLALVELKAAALRALSHADVLSFLGIRPAHNRAAVYDGLSAALSADAQRFWAEHRPEIERGVVHAGKFERYLRAFGRGVLPLIHSRKTIERLMAPRSPAERAAFYDEVWNNRRWRWLFRLAMSRTVLGRGGRDPAFFRHVEGPVGVRLLNRVGRALRTLPLETNPYLDYILHGNYTRALPRYLKPDVWPRVRDNLDALTLHGGPVEDAVRAFRGAGGFDGFNLSDIFEYLAPDAAARVYGGLLEHARPGARFAYWNLLAPRRCPPSLADRVRLRADLAGPLFERDAAFFYDAFVVEETL